MKTIKELRDRTGLGILNCKEALIECDCDIEKAIVALRKKGLAKVAKQAGKATEEGYLGSYIHHNGKIGVLIEMTTNTDFCARSDDFQKFLKDVTLHIAGIGPRFLDEESVPAEEVEKEKEIYLAQMAEDKKPDNIKEKIIAGKLKKFFEEACLMDQKLMTDEEGKTVQVHLDDLRSKTGENINITRFIRWELGKA